MEVDDTNDINKKDDKSKKKILNTTRFVIPFYLMPSYKIKSKELFDNEAWEPIEWQQFYLTKYIQEIYDNKSSSICASYRLKQEKRVDFGLPESNVEIFIESRIKSDDGEDYSFILNDIFAFYFSPGIGFLILEIAHNEDETLQEITDKSYAFSHIFTNEHDQSEAESKITAYYYSDKDIKNFISLKNVVYYILKVDQLNEMIQLFPTDTRRKMNTYHRIFRQQQDWEHKEDNAKTVRFLSRGLPSDAIGQKEKNDFFEGDFEYLSTESTSWNICSNGVVSLTYDNAENHSFLVNQYAENVNGEYFLIYLFTLHEREILMQYNYEVVHNWNNVRKIIAMRTELVKFNLCFSYNTVSGEVVYQNFYECLYKALKLENLKKDIQEVVVQVNEYVSENKERKLNGILSVIAFWAILSVFTDGLVLADRFYNQAPFELAHIVVIGVLAISIGGGVIYFLHRKK